MMDMVIPASIGLGAGAAILLCCYVVYRCKKQKTTRQGEVSDLIGSINTSGLKHRVEQQLHGYHQDLGIEEGGNSTTLGTTSPQATLLEMTSPGVGGGDTTLKPALLKASSISNMEETSKSSFGESVDSPGSAPIGKRPRVTTEEVLVTPGYGGDFVPGASRITSIDDDDDEELYDDELAQKGNPTPGGILEGNALTPGASPRGMLQNDELVALTVAQTSGQETVSGTHGSYASLSFSLRFLI